MFSFMKNIVGEAGLPMKFKLQQSVHKATKPSTTMSFSTLILMQFIFCIIQLQMMIEVKSQNVENNEICLAFRLQNNSRSNLAQRGYSGNICFLEPPKLRGPARPRGHRGRKGKCSCRSDELGQLKRKIQYLTGTFNI